MVDQVSLMASGGLSASRMRWLMNFLACWPGRLVVSRMKGTSLMCGYLSNLFFSALLAISPGFVLAAETRDTDTDTDTDLKQIVRRNQGECIALEGDTQTQTQPQTERKCPSVNPMSEQNWPALDSLVTAEGVKWWALM